MSAAGESPTAQAFGGRVIYEHPLPKTPRGKQLLDISPYATDGCFRLIDCVALTEDKILRIWEFPKPPLYEYEEFNAPKFRYSTVSYVWKGNGMNSQQGSIDDDAAGFLSVKGAEHADPISISVLHAACLATMGHSGFGKWCMIYHTGYLWLDQLCIVQTSKKDKNHQIMQMYRVYKCGCQCLILAGGLQRLVSLDEETPWIGRAWTLQECLASRYAVVLFAWACGTGVCQGTSNFRIREAGQGKDLAVARLVDIVRACFDKPMRFTVCPVNSLPREWDEMSKIDSGVSVNIQLLGKGHADLFALHQALMNFLDYEEPFTPSSTHRNYGMIWRCALMRTSSRPVDMVFSIMQLMGVTLDPSVFDPNERLGATIALASKILDEGGSADWLGLPGKIPPCLHLSTFPQFAKTDVAGGANFLQSNRWCTGRSLDDWAFAGTFWDNDTFEQRLYGKMDDKGYLIFTRKACKIVPVLSSGKNDCPQWPLFQDTQGAVWFALDESPLLEIDDHTQQQVDIYKQGAPQHYMVPLWDFIEPVMVNKFEMQDLALANSVKKFMLLTEHATKKFHIISYFYSRKVDGFNYWKEMSRDWKELDLVVGGLYPSII
jgi:hypothetical protein